MISLPLAVFQFVKSPEPTMIARGFGTAAVLMLLVVILFVIARIIGSDTVAKKEKRRAARQRLIHNFVFFFTSLARAALRFGRWLSAEIAFRNRRSRARKQLTNAQSFDAPSNNKGANKR
jgi:hypothetical protein